jgi:hypothetical protein
MWAKRDRAELNRLLDPLSALAQGNTQAQQKLLMEQTAYAPPFELVNPWAQFYDGLKLLFPLFPARFDYRYSQNYIYLTQGQLDLFRAYSRYLYETNPYAQGALECLADYVVGTGYEYHAQSRKYAKASAGLIKSCNKFLEDFLNRNYWWMLEREFYIRPRRDGDAFLRFFPQDDGVTKVRAVEPEQVRYITDSSPEWSFGILTDPDDRVDIQAYHIWYSSDSADGETVNANEMLMFKNHLDMNVKRGISDFFNLQDLLSDADKLNRAGRQGEAVRQSIAYVRQFQQANAGAVLALQAASTDLQLPQYNVTNPGGNGQGNIENVTMVQPGEVHDIPKGLEFQNGPTGNAENCQLMLDSTLRAAAVKMRVPAWVFTADVQANFAAALVQESPLVKRCEWDQFSTIKKFVEVCHYALRIGAEQGILPQDVLEQVQVEAEGVPIAARNLQQETEICAVLRQNKLLSKRTWSARENLDYDVERANILDEENDPEMQALEPTNEGTPEGEENGAPSGTPGAEYQRDVNRPG